MYLQNIKKAKKKGIKAFYKRYLFVAGQGEDLFDNLENVMTWKWSHEVLTK